MIAPIMYKTELEVGAKLDQFGVSIEDAIRIVRAVVTAHNDAVDFDPTTAAGQFRYIYGTRAVRELWCSKGWEVDRERGIESVYNSEQGTKIVYQSVDRACDDIIFPQAVSGKGDASRRLVERSTTGYLFPEMEKDEERALTDGNLRNNATTWYFCVSVEGDEVRAELSLPFAIEGDNFSGFIERIYIITGGDWAGSGLIDLDDDDEALEFEPLISKK